MSTTKGNGSGCPRIPVWLLPESTTIRVGVDPSPVALKLNGATAKAEEACKVLIQRSSRRKKWTNSFQPVHRRRPSVPSLGTTRVADLLHSVDRTTLHRLAVLGQRAV